ncbi:MAG: hypothetical protein J6D57_13825 [Mogibacterium sp.]|nr:hypothetical protein [Mogibacterium sp.]
MKTFRRSFTIMLSLMLALTLSGLAVFAADEDSQSRTDNANITYTITLYSGDSGTFSDGTTVKTIKGLGYGETVRLDINSAAYKPVINSDVADKYYAKGFKPAGHDNDEFSQLQLADYEYPVTGDASFTVAYGIQGGMVKYTVNYLDANGNVLHPSGEFYGMIGDRPVVSYKYIEGFAPAVYNFTRTLVKDESKNVFDFVYSESNLTAEEQAQQAATTGRRTAAGAANAADGANAGANNADGTAIGDNATPAAGAPNVVDLDDGNTPQAAPQSDVPKSELSRQKTLGFIIGGVCVAAAVAAAAVAIARRRQYEYEDDDE